MHLFVKAGFKVQQALEDCEEFSPELAPVIAPKSRKRSAAQVRLLGFLLYKHAEEGRSRPVIAQEGIGSTDKRTPWPHLSREHNG